MKSDRSKRTSKPTKAHPRAGRSSLWIFLGGIGLVAAIPLTIHFTKRPPALQNKSNMLTGSNRVDYPAMTVTGAQNTATADNVDPTNLLPARLTVDDAAQVLNFGNQLVKEGKARAAIEVYKRVLQLTPDDEEVHFSLGYAYSRNNQLDEAVREYNESLRLFPDYAEAIEIFDKQQAHFLRGS